MATRLTGQRIKMLLVAEQARHPAGTKKDGKNVGGQFMETDDAGGSGGGGGGGGGAAAGSSPAPGTDIDTSEKTSSGESVGDVLERAKGLASNFKNNSIDSLAKMENPMNSMKDLMSKALDAVIKSSREVAATVGKAIAETWKKTEGSRKKIGEALSKGNKVLGDAYNAGVAAGQEAVNKLRSSVTKVSPDVAKVKENAKNAFSSVTDAISKSMEGPMKEISGQIDKAKEGGGAKVKELQAKLEDLKKQGLNVAALVFASMGIAKQLGIAGGDAKKAATDLAGSMESTEAGGEGEGGDAGGESSSASPAAEVTKEVATVEKTQKETYDDMLARYRAGEL